MKPEYVGLLVEAVDYLDAHSDDYEMQLGGARNFGGGIPDARVTNPLYSDAEVRRVFDRAKDATAEMTTKDDVWQENLRQQFVQALQERVNADGGDV